MVGALVVARFPVACELAEKPRLRVLPLAVSRPDGAVWAASAAAEAVGVAEGMAMREAITRCPTLVVVEGRPALYQARAQAILEGLERTALEVEPGPEGIVYVGLRGLRGLYGSARNLAEALLRCSPAELEPRLGMAAGKFLALAAARAAKPGGWRIVSQDAAGFLAAQPVDALPVSEETRRRLRSFGLGTLAAVAGIPPSMLAAQFGREGELIGRLARGEDDELVRPRPRLPKVTERIDFESPLTNLEALLAAAELALTRALRQPAMLCGAARRLTVRVSTESHAFWERAVTFREALSERDRIWTVLRSVLGRAQLPGPVIQLRLELDGLTAAGGRQLPLPLMSKRLRDHLEEAMRQLKAHYGYCPVGRIVEVEPWSRIPERRLALIDYDP